MVVIENIIFDNLMNIKKMTEYRNALPFCFRRFFSLSYARVSSSSIISLFKSDP